MAPLPRLVLETAPRAVAVRDTGIATGASGNVCVCMFAVRTSSDITTTFKPVVSAAKIQDIILHRRWRLHLFLSQSTFLLPDKVYYSQLKNACKVIRHVCLHT